MEVFGGVDIFHILWVIALFAIGLVGTILQIMDKAQKSNIQDTWASFKKYMSNHQLTIFKSFGLYVIMFAVSYSLDELTVLSAFLSGYASQDFLNTRVMKGKDFHKVDESEDKEDKPKGV